MGILDINAFSIVHNLSGGLKTKRQYVLCVSLCRYFGGFQSSSSMQQAMQTDSLLGAFVSGPVQFRKCKTCMIKTAGHVPRSPLGLLPRAHSFARSLAVSSRQRSQGATPLRLWDMYSFARHQTPVDHEYQDHRVYLEGCPSKPHAPGYRIVDPPPRDPPRHEGVEPKSGRDGCPLKICRLSCGILGDGTRSDVEARQARQSAEHEEGEAEVIQGGADANGECDGGGGNAEGDLFEFSVSALCIPICGCALWVFGCVGWFV